jgi:hypothetical protein
VSDLNPEQTRLFFIDHFAMLLAAAAAPEMRPLNLPPFGFLLRITTFFQTL